MKEKGEEKGEEKAEEKGEEEGKEEGRAWVGWAVTMMGVGVGARGE